MALRFARPCKSATCSKLTRHPSGYCNSCRQVAGADKKIALTGIEKRRSTAAKRGYDARWRKARAKFLAENPMCEMCKARGLYVSATVVDHIKPHRGDQKLFWDQSNWQALCATCHNSEKQRQERRLEGAGAKSLGFLGVDRSVAQSFSLRKNQKLFPNAVEHSEKSV